VVFDDLVILGSGTIVPYPGHGCSGYLLRGNTKPLLLDCGPGVLYRLAEIDVSAADIDTILLTHFHLDHVSDLAALLNSRWLQTRPEACAIEIVGPVGTQAHLSWLAMKMDSWFADYQFTVFEGPCLSRTTAGLRVRTARTGHTEESICYRLEDERGHILFYSGGSRHRNH
jgi:ribonuclease BN (tRNA processing enzyme)